jgi:hypothetical protein
MQITEFKSVVLTFADPGTELLFDSSDFAISVNGDLISARIISKAGDIYVDEGSGAQPGTLWILNRLARLPLLAARLRDAVPPTDHFVSPSVSLLQTLEKSSEDQLKTSPDGLGTCLEALKDPSPLETTVLYITSDAGEGKTSLINQMAREQATLYIEHKADWLLVPIPLGGRHFLRFDDITVGVMQNRYRFPYLYYQSFLALVRMGVIVPAFDGFEEMFVESSSGEALSAMGILVSSLESRGAMVVAARKAYFEFESLKTKERLFDTIRGYSVGFAQLEIHRWGKQQFIEYCTRRGMDDAENLYQCVSERLGSEHALLTRAVLVKRLVDVAVKSPSIDGFLEQLHHSGADYFSVFVRGLIEREATEKWIDRSGERNVGTPLLTVEEHCELLSQVALSMWEAKVDYLKRDSLELAADYYCEMARKNAFQAQQVRERLRGHAMLIPSPNSSQAVEFDHDEFRLFFLGEGIARQIRPLNAQAKVELLGTFRRGVIPNDGMQALIRALTRDTQLDRARTIKFLLELTSMDSQASYTHENASALIVALLSDLASEGLVIEGLSFGSDALIDKKLSGHTFRGCYFANTSLDFTELRKCSFIRCTFSQLRFTDNTVVSEVSMEDCTVDAVVPNSQGREFWNPAEIRHSLLKAGVFFREDKVQEEQHIVLKDEDEELVAIDKLIRYFMRSTHISESVIKMKLSKSAQSFIDETLPELERCGIVEEIKNLGSGGQRRFRLGVTLERLQAAMSEANGDFRLFMRNFE